MINIAVNYNLIFMTILFFKNGTTSLTCVHCSCVTHIFFYRNAQNSLLQNYSETCLRYLLVEHTCVLPLNIFLTLSTPKITKFSHTMCTNSITA
jgi:hypothetical protein